MTGKSRRPAPGRSTDPTATAIANGRVGPQLSGVRGFDELSLCHLATACETIDKELRGMHNVWIALRTTPRILWVIGAVGLAYLLAKIYIFDSIPEIFSRAFEVGRVAQDLVEATLAALIFFVVSIQLPLVLEQQRVGPAMYGRVDRIVGRVLEAFNRPYRERPGHPVPSALAFKDITLELVTQVFGDIDPNAHCTSMLDKTTMKHATWIRAFAITDEKCQEIIDEVWRYGRFLDTEIAALLSEMQASSYSQLLKSMSGTGIYGANLRFFAGEYFSILGTALRLARCAEKLRKRYGIPQVGGVG
jgi:hypothetical protein